MRTIKSLLFSENTLFTSRRFLPMFVAQFLGALEDNLFRNALFVFVAFQSAATSSSSSGSIIAFGAGLFILPFFLFSAAAGTLADKMEKARLVKWLKFVELLLMIVAATAIVTHLTAFMLFALFLLGVQAAFFGPVKYSILPQLVYDNELVAANGYVEGGTFIAILLGTIAGGSLVTVSYGTAIVAFLLIALAIIGWLVSLALPHTLHGDETLRIKWNPVVTTKTLLREAMSNATIGRAMLGISWFWFIGALFLSMLPNYVKDILNGTPPLLTFLLTLFTIGIALGSFVCNRLLHGQIDTRFVPLALVVMAAAMADLYGLHIEPSPGQTAVTLFDFLSSRAGLSITGLFLLMAVAGGIYTVPLYATLQVHSDENKRARIIAANNILNSLMMVASSAFCMAMLKVGYQVTTIFFVAGVFTFITAIYSCDKLSDRLMGAVLRPFFTLLYKAQLNGISNVASLGGRGCVYVANHTSLIDGLLLAAFLPDHPMIVASAAMRRTLGMRLYYFLSGHPTIDLTDAMQLKLLVNRVRSGGSIVIFPEGRVTLTGILMKVYETPGIIANTAKAPLVPVRIDGAQHTPFSMLRGKVRLRLFPQITISILSPVMLKADAHMSSHQRRQSFGNQLYDIMANMMFASCNIDQTVYEAFLEAASLQGPKTQIIEDADRQPRSYRFLITLSRVLGRKLAKFTAPRESVGVMLPNTIGMVGVILSLMAYGRIPALLNFTAGLPNLRAACLTAQIKTVITSRRFINLMNLVPVIKELNKTVKIVFVEDIKKRINILDKLCGLFESCFADMYYRSLGIKPNDPAVVLFTSGSENAPKGVVLSHANIVANRYQLSTRIDLYASDTLFSALPLFHSFGLTVGLFLPILTGVKAFVYPSPLHYRIIPELMYEVNATILISTDTFLNGYGRNAHPYDFYGMRYIVAGGEKLRPETRQLWFEKFNIRILEGYGVTETSPVLCINTPMHNRFGTVGRLLPGLDYRLRTIDGIENGGSLMVRGPNIMLGYMKNDRPGVLQPPYNGWHDTGDVAEVDGDGFVKIVGRAKRFAKVGGEMISLGAIEAYIHAAYPGKGIAAVSVPDPRRGEQIILYTDETSLTRDKLIELTREKNLPELMIPRQVVIVDQLPLLGTGKTDYVTLNKMAAARVEGQG